MKRLKDSLKFAAGLRGLRPERTWGESCGILPSSFSLAFAAFPLASLPLFAASGSAAIDSFSTASCRSVMDEIVWALNICPRKPESRKGSSGCTFCPAPGTACTSCARRCCMFWSCIIDAMALVSKVPSHSGAGRRSSASAAETEPSGASSPASASSSPPSPELCLEPFLPFFLSSLFVLSSLEGFLANCCCCDAKSSSSIGRRMSSHICRSTSKDPPPRASSWVIERSVLRRTSRTWTGLRRASVACFMNSWSAIMVASSGQPSMSLVSRGSIFRRLRMKSWSFSRLCIAGDSSICWRMSGFCSTWRCRPPSCPGVWVMS
mmetsp:Transcript_46111/g.121827  ORF Transcript_46111/g.121827 Transcript_46111/m.121827 type:complete len:321 (-) Transcript_46111:370-1332(-)